MIDKHGCLIVYSAIMVVIGIWGLQFWKMAGRKVLFGAFAVLIVVGFLGVWLHEKEKPWNSVTAIAQAWQTPIVKRHKQDSDKAKLFPGTIRNDDKKKKKPKPQLVPLAYAGIGLLKMLTREKDVTNADE